MSLKEITKEVHQAAEDTKFMRSVFKKQMPVDVWKDFTYNKMLWYGAIETKARSEGYLDDLPDIDRAYKLYQDYKDLCENRFLFQFFNFLNEKNSDVRMEDREYIDSIVQIITIFIFNCPKSLPKVLKKIKTIFGQAICEIKGTTYSIKSLFEEYPPRGNDLEV